MLLPEDEEQKHNFNPMNKLLDSFCHGEAAFFIDSFISTGSMVFNKPYGSVLPDRDCLAYMELIYRIQVTLLSWGSI